VNVRALLAEHGSPLWLADADRVRERLRRFRAAWRAEWPDTEVAYSYKSNRLLAFLCVLNEEGARPEVVCEAEYRLAREIVGAFGNEIVVNGPAKPASLLGRAAADGALVLVDSRAELERAAAAGVGRVGLRVAVNGHTERPTRFGIAAAEIGDAAAQAATLGLEVEALSCHVVSTDFDSSSGDGGVAVTWPRPPDRHVDAARLLARLARALGEQGFDIDALDLGGGFPAPPAVAEHARTVAAAMRAEGYAARLVLEPGRAIVHDAVELVCTVVAEKALEDGTRCVIVDAGTNLVPGAAATPLPIVAVDRYGPERAALITGPLCLNVDVLHRRAELPALEPGDPLIVREVGAYAQSASTQFGEPRPATVVRQDGRLVLAQRRERLEDLVRAERLPPPLEGNGKPGYLESKMAARGARATEEQV